MNNKKFLLGVGALTTLMTPVLAIVSCNEKKKIQIKSQWDVPPKYEGTKINNSLGVIVSDPENPRWQKTKNFAEKNGRAIFAKVKTNIAKKSNEQTSWINTHAAWMNALIVGASDNTIAGTWQNFPKEKPVIAFDRLVKTNNRQAYNWYVTYDNSLVGRMQGIAILNHIYKQKWTTITSDINIKEYIADNQLSTLKTIISVAGDPADNNAKLFFDGAMDLFKEIIKVDANFKVPNVFKTFSNVAQDGWNYDKGRTFLQDKITAMSKADRKTIVAILSPNDGMATAAIEALRQAKLDPTLVFISGQDANDSAILSIAGEKNPGQDMTISKPDSLATAIAIALAKELVLDSAKYNVSPSELTEVNKAALLKAIKTAFPNIDIKYDGTQYATNEKGASPRKPINTILLTPQVIKKANIGASKAFEIIK